MSATNTTPNIGLPSFIGTDKPAWLTDWNGAMSTIDTEIGTIKTGMSGDETRIGNLENSVSSLNSTVSNHTTSITALNTQVATQGGTINTITSLIGNGTPTTTDQTIIGAINELHADQGDLADLVTTNKSSFVAAINEVAGGGGGSVVASAVSYDNTASGMSATDVQAAIDELVDAGAYDFNLTQSGDLTVTAASGITVFNLAGVHFLLNTAKTVGKVYGGFECTIGGVTAQIPAETWTTVATMTSATMPTFTNTFNIEIGVTPHLTNSGAPYGHSGIRLHFNTNGSIEVQIYSTLALTSDTYYLYFSFPACIYFLEDLGD